MSTPPKLPPLPPQDEPVGWVNGVPILINPVWYQWLKVVEAKIKVL